MRKLVTWIALGAMLIIGAAPAEAARDADKSPAGDTRVQVLAINDYHGNLEPPTGSSGRIPVAATRTVDAGGVEYLSTHVKRLEAAQDRSFFVAAGDLIGGTPLLSGLFHDEPAVESLNLIGMDFAGVGNHEFDEGPAELLRMQNGGCHPHDGCQDGDPFAGAAYQYLAANVFYQGTDDTVLPPYKVAKVGNAKLAFIGLTLEGTPQIVTPAGVAGLEFRPEVQTVNRLVRKLRNEQGVRSFVVLIHQGGQQNAPYPGGFQDVNRCDNFSGDIVPIVNGLSDAVDVVVSAHTHQPYVCQIAGKLVTAAASFGRLVTDIDLTIDHQTKDVTAALARNVIVTRDVPKDPAQTELIAKYNRFAAPIADRVVGSVTTDISRAPNAAGESALGDVIADAQLAATSPSDFGGAVVAFMNPGGIRADLPFDSGPEGAGKVTYRELYTVQPFNNVMTVLTLKGDQIRRLLEQQFDNPSAGQNRILQVSHGFRYSYDRTRPAGQRVDPASISINGSPVDPQQSYRVAMNNFLAGGGDGFTVFKEGTDQLGGEIDLDVLVRYFMERSPVAPGPQDRITRTG